MHLNTQDGQRNNQISPDWIDRSGVRQKSNDPLKKSKSLVGFGYREPKTASRGCGTRAHVPKLRHVLRGHCQGVAAYFESLARPHAPTNATGRAVNQAQQDAGVEQNNHQLWSA
jgi:hypothetical protein